MKDNIKRYIHSDGEFLGNLAYVEIEDDNKITLVNKDGTVGELGYWKKDNIFYWIKNGIWKEVDNKEVKVKKVKLNRSIKRVDITYRYYSKKFDCYLITKKQYMFFIGSYRYKSSSIRAVRKFLDNLKDLDSRYIDELLKNIKYEKVYI